MGVKKKISLDNFKENINKFGNNIFCPNLNIVYKKIDTNSCFNIQKYDHNQEFNNINIKFNNKNNETGNTYNYCKKVKLYPTKQQKKTIHKWLNAYLEMYNLTINHIKCNVTNHKFKLLKDIYYKKNKLEIQIKKDEKQKNKFIKEKIKLVNKLNKKYEIKRKTIKVKNDINGLILEIRNFNRKIKNINILLDDNNKILAVTSKNYSIISKYIEPFLDWYNVRNTIKNIRDDLVNRLFKNDNKPIKKHILDCAIKQACTMYKQCKTNYMKNNIKKFRIRYWRKNKKTLQMEIGSEFVKQLKEDNTFNICYDIFGKFKCYYNNQPYIMEKKTVNLHYDQISKNYTLLVSDTKPIIETKKTNYISIDEGVRTFCTGLSNKEVLKIGTNISSRIESYLKRIDKINKLDDLSQKDKAKKASKYNRKISNIVSELHWKTAKYLTDNYKNIVIGNLSMKNASQSENISKMTKRI